MAWLFAESENPRVTAAFIAQNGEANVPVLLYYELCNVLLVAERRGRVTQSQSAAFLDQLAKLAIRMAPPAEEEAMALARARTQPDLLRRLLSRIGYARGIAACDSRSRTGKSRERGRGCAARPVTLATPANPSDTE